MEPAATSPIHRDGSGRPGPRRLVVRAGGRRIAEMILEAGPITVGQAADCGLVVAHPTVSRRHVEVDVHGGGLRLRDLGSTNGTWYQGSAVREIVVPLGATVLLGDAEMYVDDAAAPPPVQLGDLVTVARSMRPVVALLAKVAESDATVLLGGETGCGKEVAARALHQAGPRRTGPMEVVDCGALPRELAASELFGHVKGAFTGADRERPGAFERADGGTLFLDEVGELPADLQPMLLRVLETREVRRVGDGSRRRVDVRIVAATNRDLDAEAAAGRFRADLLHRLAVVRVILPPLRDRPEDIPFLVREFLAAMGPRAAGVSLSPATMRALTAYRWPGNVRELRNLVERAVALSEQAGIGPADLGLPAAAEGGEMPLDYRQAREGALAAFEKDYIVHLLRRCERNISRAAREAGIERGYLHRLIRRHAILVEEL